MIEKNRNILSDAINKMPLRKPKASNWLGISTGLDKVEASAFVAKNASRLPRHKAPAEAWSKVAAGLPPATAAFFASIWGKLIIASLIIGSLGAIYLLTLYPEDEMPLLEPETNIVSSPPIKQTPPPELKSEEKISEVVIKEELDNVRVQETNDEGFEEVAFAQAPPTAKPTPLPIIPQRHDLQKLFVKDYIPIDVNRPKNLKDNSLRSFDNNYETVEYTKDLSKAQIKAGLYYSFKRYQDAGQEGMSVPQNLSSFGLDLSFEKHNWIFKTGIEYLRWKEKGGITYDYDQNQLIYQYNYVDSAHVSPVGSGVTYFTTETFVYDSVHEQMGGETTYDYNVLQIPLLVGYRILDKGKTSIGIMGGVGFDIKLSGSQFIPDFEEENSTLTDVNSSLVFRTLDNWRVIIGFDVSYRFARKWELYTEPGYQWYMKPLYSSENTKGFGLFNIKLGVRYVF